MEILMPRPRPPGLHREVTRHGTVVWYVRVGHGQRIRIRSAFGTPEFNAEYNAACAGTPIVPTGTKYDARTLGWLIGQYRQSTAWLNLKPATRAQRERFLCEACDKAGREPISRITRSSIEKGIAARKPNAAKSFLYALRGLFTWAVAAEHVERDPTAGLKAIQPDTGGYPPWSEESCRRFEAYWPLGTRERLAYEILFWSGLRIGDVVRFGPPHVNKKGMGIIVTEKTGKRAYVPVSKCPRLLAAIAAGPVGELTFIAAANGRPMNKAAFSAWFRRAARAAGVPGTAHGLRKTRATLATEAGAENAELEALMGWSPGSKMAELYTRTRNEARLAERVADKMLADEMRTSIPAPTDKVRAAEGK
jgi:integrase